MEPQTQQAVQTLGEKIKAFAPEELQEQFKDLKAGAQDKLEMATDFVKKYPISSVLGATALGYVAGRILTRKH